MAASSSARMLSRSGPIAYWWTLAARPTLKADGVNYRRGVFPYRANARARTLGDTDGMVKILADAQTDRILGVHIIGLRAGDLIAEATAAIEFGASSEDLARTCHAHPTLP